MNRPRHFLDLDAIEAQELRGILDRAAAFKKALAGNGHDQPLAGKTLAMIFEKPSTRTRVSFEVAMAALGGRAITLNADEMQLGRGESIADTARVLSRYVDIIMLRAKHHGDLLELAENASVPVINGLTDRSHPCQIVADLMTFEEHRGPVTGRIIAWVGDSNNVAVSWIHAAARARFELRLASPEPFGPPEGVVAWARGEGAEIVTTAELESAVGGADCIVTDTWVSMNSTNLAEREALLPAYQVDERVMALAKPGALFMHCLPATRGKEVSASVIDGPQSVVWDEAENRAHAQKSILAWCLE
ncbi:MAG: ornithine carbamoyltransferase [Proteobacteria bacterium]|nr:ornithine carbamoyltransferase [Pseudomonadota bacterium]